MHYCFFLITALLKYHSYIVQLMHLKFILPWLWMYSQSCAIISTFNFRASYHPKRNFISVNSQFWLTTSLYFVDLPILDISPFSSFKLFSNYKSYANTDSFTSSFPIWMPFFLAYFCWLELLVQYWLEAVRAEFLVLFLILGGKLSVFF